MEKQTKQHRILVLGGRGQANDVLGDILQDSCEITQVDTVEKAITLLGQTRFDAVLSETGDFLPLERAVGAQQAVTILNTLGEGVCIVGSDGAILWANQRMTEFPQAVREGVADRSKAAFKHFEERLLKSDPLHGENLPPRRYSFTDKESESYFEMIVTPMLEGAHRLAQVATVVWEETASRRLQQRIDAIDRAGSELVRIEAEAIRNTTVEQRIALLQDKIVRYARGLLYFDHFVVRLLNRKSNALEVLFGVGLPADEQTEVFASSSKNGITGYVAATGRSYICNHPQSDPRYLPGLDGVACSLTVPLRLHDNVIGTLNVESGKEAAFTEDDRQIAEIFGRYIAIALNILNLLVEERYQTTGQAIDLLSQNVSGPLSGIMTEASLLREEYIGHDDMRRRLQDIIDHVVSVKEAVKEAQSPPQGILDSRRPAPPAYDEQLQDKRILVVDDEQFIRETIANVLEKFGCLVVTARDGKEAIALLGQQRFDLVVSDIKLPNATGYDVFAKAREMDEGLPVILMTGFGYDPNHSIVRANREGLSAVLYKPFKVDQLMGEIRSAMNLVNDD